MAALALAVGVAGIAVMPVFGPLAWLAARHELAASAAGRRPPGTVGLAKPAQVLGMIGTVALVLVLTVFLLAVVGAIKVD